MLENSERTILMVDDDEDDHIIMKDCLRGTRFNLVTAFNPYKIKDLLNSEKPDLLMLDYNLGEVNGSEVLKEIRPCFPQLKVVIMTTYEIKEGELKDFDVIVLRKGMTPDELVRNINVIFN